MELQSDRLFCNGIASSGTKDQSSISSLESSCSGATPESPGRSKLHSQPRSGEDETNALFISAVRIFLDFVRDKHGIAKPEKSCSLENLISYLAEFQEEAKTKKGERYSPSTIRVIRYSLNRVITLGRNQLEMRPYPTQSNGCRRKRKFEENGLGDLSSDDQSNSVDRSVGESLTSYQVAFNGTKLPERDYEVFTDDGARFARHRRAGTPSMTEDNFEACPETTQSVLQGVKAFRTWLSNQGFSPVFEICSPPQLNDQLVSFYRFARNDSGNESTRSSLQTFRFAISHYLKKQAGIDILQDPVFEPSREAFRSALRNLTAYNHPDIKRQTFESTFSQNFTSTEWLGIPVESIKSIYRSGALSTSNALSLQRKVWFELTIFFRGIPCCPDQAFWNKNTFKVSADDQRLKYVELNPDMYSRLGHVIERVSQEGRIMMQRAGSPFCPVASFEIYLDTLNPSCENLFPRVFEINRVVSTSKLHDRSSILCSGEPIPPTILSRMMETIAEEANLSHRFSCLSVAETDYVAWMRALTALEIELQCQDIPEAPPELLVVKKNDPSCLPHRESHRTSVIQTLNHDRAEACTSDPCSKPQSFSPPAPGPGTASRKSPHVKSEVDDFRETRPAVPAPSPVPYEPVKDRLGWKKKLTFAFRDHSKRSQSEISDDSPENERQYLNDARKPMTWCETDQAFLGKDRTTNHLPVTKKFLFAETNLTEPCSDQDNESTCICQNNQRDAGSSPGECAARTARPTVNRISDLYRKSSPSAETKYSSPEEETEGLAEHSTISNLRSKHCQPIILVRPQITIISKRCGPIDSVLLKQGILDSIVHSFESSEWQAEIDDVVDRLRENVLEIDSQHSSSIDSSPGSATPTVLHLHINVQKRTSSAKIHREAVYKLEPTVDISDHEFSDTELEESPKLHIEETNRHDPSPEYEGGDDFHGSHRREAF